MKPTTKRTTGKKAAIAPSKTSRKIKKSTSIVSLENGIKILQIALRKKLSLSAAAKTAGRGKNYISDIKARLEENFKSKNITKELYTSFKQLNKEYEKSSK
jgi:hypothetical protein